MKTAVGRTFSQTEFLFQSAALLRRLGFVRYEWIALINGSECSEILRALLSKEARLVSFKGIKEMITLTFLILCVHL